MNGHEKSPSIKLSLEPTAEEGKKKRAPSDIAYYILKELLTTERTYKRDLEVVCVVSCSS